MWILAQTSPFLLYFFFLYVMYIFFLSASISLHHADRNIQHLPTLTLSKLVMKWFQRANVFPTSRICYRRCCYKFDVFLCPLSLASVDFCCACRTPEETTGILNKEGSGARLHAPVPARLKRWQGEGKGVGWQAKTAFAFSQTHKHIFTNTYSCCAFGQTNTIIMEEHLCTILQSYTIPLSLWVELNKHLSKLSQ